MPKRLTPPLSADASHTPTVFVASSVEGLEAARAVQSLLERDANVIVWTQGAFGSGSGALENLSHAASNTDFAVFIFTPDDTVQVRGRSYEITRQNLVLEFGIFMGLLGAPRTFIVLPQDADLKLPSDLAGIGYLQYSLGAAVPNLIAALAPAVDAIRRSMRILGPCSRSASRLSLSVPERRHAVGAKGPARRPRSDRGKLFISYSHKDKIWLTRLQTMLKPLVRLGDILVWDDTMIEPGKDWRREIRSAIASARVAFLLVSPDFLASDFIANNELPRILGSAGRGQLTILWAAASKSFWEKTKIERYQAVHDVSKPLDTYRVPAKRNQALYDVCVKIAKALDDEETNGRSVPE